MKRFVIATCLLGAAIVMPAWAQAPTKMSPLKMKCEDFVAVDEAYRPALVYYVVGVDKLGVTETDTMVEDTATPIGVLVAECQKTPKASFRRKVGQMYKSGQLAIFDHH